MKTPTMKNFGVASLGPTGPMVAGEYVTRTLTYTAGHPIDDSGYVKIVFRAKGDFGTPQFDDPAGANYCTVSATGDCRIEPRWDGKGNRRPWSKSLYLQVRFGYLDRGESIVVVFGDRSGGSPGWRVQTFAERTFEFKMLVDPIATFEFKELPKSPCVPVVPAEPSRAVCICPSEVRAGRRFAYYLKLEDAWGNPVAKPTRIVHAGFKRPGVRILRVKDPRTKLTAVSNPIDVLPRLPKRRKYWADFHGQSEETIGTGSIEEYFRFARDFGRLDICAHQGNDFQVTDAFWSKINEVTGAFYRSGKFVTFPGYEWSGNTPLGGDRNVYYKSEGGRITRSSRDLIETSRHPDSPTAEAMFRNLRGPGPFVFSHVGGRYADLRMHDPDIEVAVEVHSAWGTFEWLPADAFRMGLRVGLCANSDGHKCRPGASYPGAGEFGSLGGLTCVLAESLDRDAVHRAILARHFYATTGNRPLLDVQIVSPAGDIAMMGDIYKAPPEGCTLKVRAVGTAPIDRIEVRNAMKVVRVFRPFGKDDLGRRIKVVFSGAEVRGRNRMVRWDGELRVRGNRIDRFTPINFWNADRPVRHVGAARLAWRSVTTGGLVGVILDLEKPFAGTLLVDTVQRKVRCAVKAIGLAGRIYTAGGVGKQIQLYRLPDHRRVGEEFSFTMPVRSLRPGDNPIYVCMHQEDGHIAWSSPIYVVL